MRLAYSDDGRYLAIGTGGGRAVLRILDLQAKSMAREDADCGDNVEAVQFLLGGRLVTASVDGRVRLYDTDFRLSAGLYLAQQSAAVAHRRRARW